MSTRCHNWIQFLIAYSFALATVSGQKLIGEPCFEDSQCRTAESNLVCVQGSVKGDLHVCQCPPSYVWSEPKCVRTESESIALELVSILTPLSIAVLLSFCFLVFCCCCLPKNSEDMAGSKKHQDLERCEEKLETLNFYKEEEEGQSPKKGDLNKTNFELKEIKETTQEEKTKEKPKPKISIEPPKNDPQILNAMNIHKDHGYQASLNLLFERPSAGSEPCSRPISAMSYNPSVVRSGSAINLDRQSSLSLLVPRDMTRPLSATSVGAGRRSPIFTGPYISDPSSLRLLQKRSDQWSPKTSVSNVDIIIEETSFISEEDIARQQQKNKSAAAQERSSKNRTKTGESKKQIKVKSRSDSVGSGIEEIKLVKAAVNAFKRKTRLRDLPAKPVNQMETVVERILRLRAEQNLRQDDNNNTAQSHNGISQDENPVLKSGRQPKKRVIFSDDLTSLDSISSTYSIGDVNTNPRPESVAQRILRERQERNITAKVPVTPSSSGKKKAKKVTNKKRQPLHLALKESADKKKETSKEELEQKIKEKAHLKAVKNYSVPELPKEYYESLSKNGVLKTKDGKPISSDKPVKSILKKPTTTSKKGSIREPKSKTNNTRKVSKVNYAFQSDENEDNVNDKHASTLQITAEVY